MASRPLYQQIASQLREAIHRGDLRPGDQVPSEHELAAQHGVHRDTIRDAMNVLQQEGLIETARGRRSVVRRRRRVLSYVSDDHLTRRGDEPRGSWRKEAETQGFETHQTITVETVTPPEPVRERLQEPEDRQAVVRNRVIYVDNEPVQLARSWFPLHVAEGTPLAQPEPIPGGVRHALEDLGHQLHDDREELSARMPTPEEAHVLSLGSGLPVLQLYRTTFTTEGTAVHVDDDVLAGDCHVGIRDIPARAPAGD